MLTFAKQAWTIIARYAGSQNTVAGWKSWYFEIECEVMTDDV